MKPKEEKSKDTRWNAPPADLPGVKPQNVDSGPAPVAGSPSGQDKQDGTAGFSTQLSGHGKAGQHYTTGFSAGPPDYTLPGYPSGCKTAAGLEESGRERQASTSSVGRIIENTPDKK